MNVSTEDTLPQHAAPSEPQPQPEPVAPCEPEPQPAAAAAAGEPAPPRQPQSVRAFLAGKFLNLATLLREHGADEETLESLLAIPFDSVCAEMVRRALPHRGTEYLAAADEFLYELAVDRPPTALRKKTARYLQCFAEALGVEG